ncbi:hypothetical protein ACA910_015002 [Epithemia clementina (nom. ined.)]
MSATHNNTAIQSSSVTNYGTTATATASGDIEMGGARPPPHHHSLGTTPSSPKLGQGFLKPVPETTPLERLAAVFALCAVLMALVAMIVEGSVVVIVAGILSAIIGPFTYYQQTQLTDIRTLQETEQKMKIEVDRLTAENKRLAHNIDELSESVQGLRDMSDALDIITEQQGQSVQAFAGQVVEQRNLLDSMQSNLSAKIIDNLLSLAFGADQNDDKIIDPNEANALIRHIQNMSGVTVKEEKFRHAIAGQSADKVIDIIDNLLKENLPEEERLFIFTQEAITTSPSTISSTGQP